MSMTMVATGNISPCRFVKLVSGTEQGVAQAGAGDIVFGISGRGSRTTPLDGLDDGYHAIAGEQCHVFTLGEIAMLEVGGTIANSNRLKSDSSGKGVAASAGDNSYALAKTAGTSGKLVDVFIEALYVPA